MAFSLIMRAAANAILAILAIITNIYYILIGITIYSLSFVVKTFTHYLNLENTHKIAPDPGLLVTEPLCIALIFLKQNDFCK